MEPLRSLSRSTLFNNGLGNALLTGRRKTELTGNLNDAQGKQQASVQTVQAKKSDASSQVGGEFDSLGEQAKNKDKGAAKTTRASARDKGAAD